MTEPTDAEIAACIDAAQVKCVHPDAETTIEIARAVLAKWGTPPAVAPWRSAVLDLIDECPGLTMEQDRWLSRRVKELDFASTPQPTQAQAGVVPLTLEAINAMAREYPAEDLCGWSYRMGIADAEQHYGIKGGQHGTS